MIRSLCVHVQQSQTSTIYVVVGVVVVLGDKI